MHAASVLTTKDGQRVLSVDMRPLVIHLLSGLEQAGIERVVVTLGHDATNVAECVTAYGFTRMAVDFVYLTLGNAAGAVWRNLASSVIAARAAFSGKDEPLLIVRADNLYDGRLLKKIVAAPFNTTGFEAFALVDATPATMRWAKTARPNWARIALAEDRQRAVRCGTRLGSFDAIVAGELYAARPKVFELLASLFSQSLSTSLADAFAEVADRGALGVVEVGDGAVPLWFESRTLSGIFQPGGVSQNKSFAHLCSAARELLYSGEWRPTANMPTPPLRGELEKRTEPLLSLGSTLGEGANGVVVEAEPGVNHIQEAASSRLAVKMFRPSADDRKHVEAIMWEVHVLRQLRGHDHIVKLCDVVELADAVVYVVMERIEGPDLLDYIRSQPGGVLIESAARRFFRHMLSALRHAHSRGFLHCDLKPANVRLQMEGNTPARGGADPLSPMSANRLTAVLVDWGLARQIGDQPAHTMMGTAAYASPEQLTGYNVDSAWGRAKLGPHADVWALGTTLYEMLSGRVPFGGKSHDELVANALALNYDVSGSGRLALPARQLVDSMLQVIPNDRSTLHELCADPWTVGGGEGPMPPEEDAVTVDCRTATPSPTHNSEVSGQWPMRRILLYAVYASLVLWALWYGATHQFEPIAYEED